MHSSLKVPPQHFSQLEVWTLTGPLQHLDSFLLRNKLVDIQVDVPLVAWITNYLTGRPQYVRLQNIVSDTIVSSTGIDGLS